VRVLPTVLNELALIIIPSQNNNNITIFSPRLFVVIAVVILLPIRACYAVPAGQIERKHLYTPHIYARYNRIIIIMYILLYYIIYRYPHEKSTMLRIVLSLGSKLCNTFRRELYRASFYIPSHSIYKRYQPIRWRSPDNTWSAKVDIKLHAYLIFRISLFVWNYIFSHVFKL